MNTQVKKCMGWGDYAIAQVFDFAGVFTSMAAGAAAVFNATRKRQVYKNGLDKVEQMRKTMPKN